MLLACCLASRRACIMQHTAVTRQYLSHHAVLMPQVSIASVACCK
jgi:hypothetical protein